MSPIILRIATTWDGRPAPDGEHVTIEARFDGDLHVRVDAPFHGDPPPPHPAGPTPALWNHEVVELFVLGLGDRYTEIEMGPGGHHLVLTLHGRRSMVADRIPLDFTARVEGDRWHGRARLSGSWLPPGSWRVNAHAIHGVGPDRRYLSAFGDPGDAPDFHRLELLRPWAGVAGPP